MNTGHAPITRNIKPESRHVKLTNAISHKKPVRPSERYGVSSATKSGVDAPETGAFELTDMIYNLDGNQQFNRAKWSHEKNDCLDPSTLAMR